MEYTRDVIDEVLRFDLHELDISPRNRALLGFFKHVDNVNLLKNDGFVHEILLELFDRVASKETAKEILVHVKKEFYLFFCTNDARYESVRRVLTDGLAVVVPALATIIVASFTVPAAIPVSVVVSILAALMFLALKVGKNAWCAINANLATLA